jgi:DNA gyrase subunit B
MLPRPPLKLDDCIHHGIGSGAELYVVEGDSAAGAVSRMRRAHFQAVLPMQGKPLNAVRATAQKVIANQWFAALTDALGTGLGDAFTLQTLRYDRVILLMDPDADGIHCGALVTLFFYRWMRPLLDDGRVCAARAPLATFVVESVGHPQHAEHPVRSERELRAVAEQLHARSDTQVVMRRYRGLAGTDLSVLSATCLEPATRTLRRVGAADAQAAIAVFGGGRSAQHP